MPPKVGGPAPLLSSPTGPPPKSDVQTVKGPEDEAPEGTSATVPKAAGADAPTTGDIGGCAPVDGGITHPRPEVMPPRAVLRARLACPSRQSPVTLARDPNVGAMFQKSLARAILSQRITLHLCRASMGVASHPEVSKPADQDTQPAPVDAGGAKSASPSQGAGGGKNDGNSGGVEDDAPTSQPTSRRAAMISWMGTAPVVVDPVHPMTTAIRPIQKTRIRPGVGIFRSCRKCRCLHCPAIGEPVSRPQWRHGGMGHGLSAFFFPTRRTTSKPPSLSLCGRPSQRMHFSRCWTMLQR